MENGGEMSSIKDIAIKRGREEKRNCLRRSKLREK